MKFGRSSFSRAEEIADARTLPNVSDPPFVRREDRSNVAYFQSRPAPKRARQPGSETEWADMLTAIEQTGSALKETQDRAVDITSRAEGLARSALEELQKYKGIAEAAASGQRAAEARVARAEAQAFEAGTRAESAEARASEAATRAFDAETRAKDAEMRVEIAEHRAAAAEEMLERVKHALWRNLLDPKSQKPVNAAA